jgi:hypothetical protein
MATGDIVLLWPEDIQFTVSGDWMSDVVEVLRNSPWLGTICLNYLRRNTYGRVFGWRKWLDMHSMGREFFSKGAAFRSSRMLSSSKGVQFRTFGWVWPGVVGSGIPSIARTAIWRKLGPWRTGENGGTRLADSSLGAEDDMVRRYYRSGLSLQQAILMAPVAAEIVTDPAGTKAKVRGGKRYGLYLPPAEEYFYYRIFSQEHFDQKQKAGVPLAFEDNVEPLGFELPFDKRGNLLKVSINTDIVVCV